MHGDKDTVHLITRMPAQLRRELKQYAVARDTSMSKLVCQAVEELMARGAIEEKLARDARTERTP